MDSLFTNRNQAHNLLRTLALRGLVTSSNTYSTEARRKTPVYVLTKAGATITDVWKEAILLCSKKPI